MRSSIFYEFKVAIAHELVAQQHRRPDLRAHSRRHQASDACVALNSRATRSFIAEYLRATPSEPSMDAAFDDIMGARWGWEQQHICLLPARKKAVRPRKLARSAARLSAHQQARRDNPQLLVPALRFRGTLKHKDALKLLDVASAWHSTKPVPAKVAEDALEIKGDPMDLSSDTEPADELVRGGDLEVVRQVDDTVGDAVLDAVADTFLGFGEHCGGDGGGALQEYDSDVDMF